MRSDETALAGQQKSRAAARLCRRLIWATGLLAGLALYSGDHVTPDRLAVALANLSKAIIEVEALVADLKCHRDPLASHIYSARRSYRGISDTKSGKRHAMVARTSWQRACELGFRGNLADWERLIAAGE